jgi:thioredoxin-related protein
MKNILVFTLLLMLLISNAGLALEAKPSVQGEDLFSGRALDLVAKSKGLVVTFLSARCPCSNSHVPMLEKLSHEFPDFQFVAVHSNADETAELAQNYFKESRLSVPVIQDKDSKLADRFKALKTPHVFVLDAKGEIVFKGGMTNSSEASGADRQYLKEALLALQAGKKVETPEARSLGCAISRGETHVW